MSAVIKVENLSKQYRLGNVGTGSLAHDMNRTWHRIRGKEDPYLKIGEENDRASKGSSDYVWALRDINFEVKQGEVLGIIGRNGAGKSTLLKILSRTTSPTTGSIKIKGRVASLLEVGTGFHPELTGRENIFLNGTILGMTKKEIKSKFDEIVDFAGVERYIDTPVKRYSSGMYVRLAFGVAAHLEPEILIVDEVLAVGDLEFQKKALGKMKDVSGKEGRTVLFVSHNLISVENLCNRGLFLENGKISVRGEINEVINYYLNSTRISSVDFLTENEKRLGNGKIRIKNIQTFNSQNINTENFRSGEQIKINFSLSRSEVIDELNIIISFYNDKEILIANISNQYSGIVLNAESDNIQVIVSIPFKNGNYFCNVGLFKGSINNPVIYDKLENIPLFSIEGGDLFKTGVHPNSGIIILKPDWRIEEIITPE